MEILIGYIVVVARDGDGGKKKRRNEALLETKEFERFTVRRRAFERTLCVLRSWY